MSGAPAGGVGGAVPLEISGAPLDVPERGPSEGAAGASGAADIRRSSPSGFIGFDPSIVNESP